MSPLVSGTTGQTIAQTGTYKTTDGCNASLALTQGDQFPPCPTCGHATGWRMNT